MKIIFIAWRNIWRNKRRTAITIASVSAALFFALIMRSFQDGSYERMIYNYVHSYTGHIQIHSDGYFDNQSIDNAFEYNDSIKELIEVDGVEKTMLQITSGGSVSYKNISKFTSIIAGNPEQDLGENLIKNIVCGEVLKNNDNAILIAEGLAKYLKIITYDTICTIYENDTLYEQKARMIADSVVIISQGMYGESAYGLFRVKGVIKYPDPKMNKAMIYMPLQAAQTFLTAENMITSIAIVLENEHMQNAIVNYYDSTFQSPLYEVMTWQQMNQELIQQIESDKKSGILMIGILYIIIGFGIFGTIVMMTAERLREFAIMIALGMKKTKLILQFCFEMLYMGILGVLVGILAAIPVLVYYVYNPIQFTGEMAAMIEEFGMEAIMPVSFNLQLFIDHGILVFVLFAVSTLYTIAKIRKLDVISAIRN